MAAPLTTPSSTAYSVPLAWTALTSMTLTVQWSLVQVKPTRSARSGSSLRCSQRRASAPSRLTSSRVASSPLLRNQRAAISVPSSPLIRLKLVLPEASGLQVEDAGVEQVAQLLQQVVEILVADVGVVFAHDVAQRPAERDRRAGEAGDIALAVTGGHDPHLADPQVAVHLAIGDRRPGDVTGNRVERLAQLRLLMDREVGRPRRREPPDELVVVLERPARRWLQLDRLVDLAVGDPARDRQRLDRVQRRARRIHLAGALIERHDEVVQLVLRAVRVPAAADSRISNVNSRCGVIARKTRAIRSSSASSSRSSTPTLERGCR